MDKFSCPLHCRDCSPKIVFQAGNALNCVKLDLPGPRKGIRNLRGGVYSQLKFVKKTWGEQQKENQQKRRLAQPTDLDVALSSEVVDFGGLHIGDDLHEACAVCHVPVVQLEAL